MKKLLTLLIATVLLSTTVQASLSLWQLWAQRYGGSGYDYANDMVLDNQGYVYVTGTLNGDYCTLKYSPFGQLMWAITYNGTGNSWDEATAITLDEANNVYVTGKSCGTSGYSPGEYFDYATIKYLQPTVNSVDQSWVQRYNGSGNGNDGAVAVVYYPYDLSHSRDGGYIYVTGSSWGGSTTQTDYLTLQYTSDGALCWANRYSSVTDAFPQDYACDMVVDDEGNSYITGGFGHQGVYNNFGTISYDFWGELRWVAGNGGSYGDVAHAIALGPEGNVYVTGFLTLGPSSSNYLTLKLNSTNGELMWQIQYNGTGSGEDQANDIAVDASGNVYVTGWSDALTGSSLNVDYATVKYSQPTPTSVNQVWAARYNGSSNGHDQANAITLDSNADVYVTGECNQSYSWSGGDYGTVKYNKNNGAQVWVKVYNGPGNSHDAAKAIAVNAFKEVYVTGGSYGTTTGSDFATVKYGSLCVAWPVDDNTTMSKVLDAEPDDYRISNHPQPFNPSTTIGFKLQVASHVDLRVYDTSGRLVTTLVNGWRDAGNYDVTFDGSGLASGVYIYQLTAAEFQVSGKMMLMK